MQLNEIIEENSIATISKRTRIPIDNIEKLVDRNFSDMKKVKALGFISILEREFGIELDTLRKECNEYFYAAPDEEFDARLVVTVPESGERSGGKYSKLFILILLFAIGYGAWYFLANNTSNAENNSTTTNTGFIGSIMSQAQEWLGNSSTLDSETVAMPSEEEGVWAKNNNTKESNTNRDTEKSGTDEKKREQTDNARATNAEKNDSAFEEEVIREVKDEQKEIIAKEVEKKDTEEATIDNAMEPDKIVEIDTDNVPAGTQEDEALVVEVSSVNDETTADEIVAIKEKPKTTKKAAKETNKNIITLVPLKKVWVGYTELRSMKRSAKLIEEEISFDTSESSWILVAGHNAINFIIDGDTMTPKTKGKNYFLIKNGKVENISKEEFQKLNKSTVW